ENFMFVNASRAKTMSHHIHCKVKSPRSVKKNRKVTTDVYRGPRRSPEPRFPSVLLIRRMETENIFCGESHRSARV
ncbi:MAG: hypothetical protein CMM07_19045, partial [Rhodopirellula sp.]|nr:hypothetical protein [Rhodopirellula sp.]